MNDRIRINDSARALFRGLMAGLAVLVLLGIYPYAPEPTRDIKVVTIQWGASLIGIGLILQSVFTKGRFTRPGVSFGPMTIWVLAMVVASLFSSHLGNSLPSISELLALYAAYLVASQVFRTPAQVRRFASVVAGAMVLCTAYGFAQRFGYDPFPWDEAFLSRGNYANMPSTFGNPNVAGHALVLAIVLALGAAGRGARIWLYPAAALFFVHLYLTQHRAGMLGLAAALAFVVTAYPLRNATMTPRETLGRIVVLLGLVCGAVIGASALLGQRDAPKYDGSLTLRFNSYYSAAKMVGESPILGHGLGNYLIENPRFWTSYEQEHFARDGMLNEHAHSEPLQMAAEGGLPGALAYMAIFAAGLMAAARRARRAESSDDRNFALLAGAFLTAFFVDGFFGFNLRAPASGFLFVTFLGMMDGVWSSRRDEGVSSELSRGSWAWRLSAITVLGAIVVYSGVVFGSRSLLQEGRGAVAWGYYDEAEALFAQGEGWSPWAWEFPYELGQTALKQGRTDQALEHFQRSDALRPNYIPTLLSLARAYVQRSSRLEEIAAKAHALDLARQVTEEATGLCPSLPDAAEMLARIDVALAQQARVATGSLDAERLESAHAHLNNALAYGTSNRAGIHLLSATIHRMTGRVKDAERELELAVENGPGREDIWPIYFKYAKDHDRWRPLLKSLAAAARQLERGGASPKTIAGVYRWKARALEETKAEAESILQAYARACDGDPENETTMRKYFEFAEDNGRLDHFEERISATREARRATGESLPILLETLGRMWADEEGLTSAVGIVAGLKGASDTGDGSARSARRLGWVVKLLMRELDHLPCTEERAILYLNIGGLAVKTELYDGAEQVLAQASEFLTGTERNGCLRARSEALLASNRPDEAVAMLRDAIEATRGELDLYVNLARTLAKAGRPDDARLEYSYLLSQFQIDPETKALLEAELAEL